MNTVLLSLGLTQADREKQELGPHAGPEGRVDMENHSCRRDSLNPPMSQGSHQCESRKSQGSE